MRFIALIVLVAVASPAPQTPPAGQREWIDPATGHRVVRLSDEPGSQTLYFHDNAFSAAGDKMMMLTPKGVGVIDVAALGRDASDGMWINLFRAQPDGTLTREKLVDMSRHNYVTGRGGVEPNVHITPDKKWVVFTGQFATGPATSSGPARAQSSAAERHVYAVEIARRK